MLVERVPDDDALRDVARTALQAVRQPIRLDENEIVVSASIGLGRHKVIAVIDKYTGNDPLAHRWFFTVGPRGMKVFALLDAVGPEPATP